MSRRYRIPGTTARRPTLYALPLIPDDAPDEIKNGLAIRNAASVSGVCPDCGAVPEIRRDSEYDRIWHAVFEHGPGCRAITDGVEGGMNLAHDDGRKAA